MAAHSFTGASSASRWLICSASVPLSKASPPSGDTVPSVMGTAAHAVSEFRIAFGDWPESVSVDFRESDGTVREVIWPVDKAMIDNLQEYVDFVEALMREPAASVGVERRVSLAPLDEALEDAFGTADCLAVVPSKRKLVCGDLKHGVHWVDHVDNVQATFYAIGAYLTLTAEQRACVDTIELVIAQPRVGDETLRTHVLDLFDLLATAMELIAGAKRVREASKVFDKEGADSKSFTEFVVPGEHCHFCNGRKICPKRKTKATEKAQQVFAPMLLTGKGISRTLNFPT